MAKSTCPKCDSTRFEIVDASITDAQYQNKFVQCAKCGAVVGVLHAKDPGVLLADVLKQLAEIKSLLPAPPGAPR